MKSSPGRKICSHAPNLFIRLWHHALIILASPLNEHEIDRSPETSIKNSITDQQLMEGDSTERQIETLIQGCVRKERHAQTRLYNLFMQKMFVVCLRYARTREEAEEILQEGFMKVFDGIHQFRFAGSFEGWMRRIMVNTALQRYRKKSFLHSVTSIDPEQVDFEVHEDIIAKLGTKELLKLIQQLPPAYRLTFNLYVFEGLKHREIAEMLNVSEGTSKSNLSDARSILQKAVAKSLQSSHAKIN